MVWAGEEAVNAAPQFMKRRFEQGAEAEEEVIARGLAKVGGLNLLAENFSPSWLEWHEESGQFEGEVWVGISDVVRCHPDGIAEAEVDGTLYVVEAKLFGPDFWKRWQAEGIAGFPKYHWQTSVEALIQPAKEMPVLFCVGLRDGEGNVLDVDVDFLRVEEQTESRQAPLFSRVDVMARLMRLKAIGRKYLDTGEIEGCDQQMFPCGLFFTHEDQKRGVEEFADGQWLDSLAYEYEAGQVMKKKGEEKRKEAGKGLKAAFEGVDGDLAGERYVVHQVNSPKQGTISVEALIEAGLVTREDAEKHRSPGSTTVYWQVREKE